MISEPLGNDFFDFVAQKHFFFCVNTLLVHSQISVCVHVCAHVSTCAWKSCL